MFISTKSDKQGHLGKDQSKCSAMSYKMRGVTEEGSEEKEGVRSLRRQEKWESIVKWGAEILSSRDREATIECQVFREAKHFMSPLGGWEWHGRLFISMWGGKHWILY